MSCWEIQLRDYNPDNFMSFYNRNSNQEQDEPIVIKSTNYVSAGHLVSSDETKGIGVCIDNVGCIFLRFFKDGPNTPGRVMELYPKGEMVVGERYFDYDNDILLTRYSTYNKNGTVENFPSDEDIYACSPGIFGMGAPSS